MRGMFNAIHALDTALMLHVQTWDHLLLPPNNLGRHSDNRSILWHILKHERARSNLHTVPNAHIAQNGRPRANEDAIPNLRMPFPMALPGPAERDVMQHGAIAANVRGLANDDAGRVVQKESRADEGGRVMSTCNSLLTWLCRWYASGARPADHSSCATRWACSA